MTMAHQIESQPQLFTGENSAPKPDTLTTSDIVILGEDSSVEQEDQPKTHEQLIEEYVEVELRSLDSWIARKITNQLVEQIHQSIQKNQTDAPINISAVRDSLRIILSETSDESFHIIQNLENEAIPYAHMQEAKPFKGGASNYWTADLDNLRDRIDVQFAVIDYVQKIEATGSDGLYDLSEEYIQRTLHAAHNEVIQDFARKARELEERRKKDAAEIAKLQGIIGELETELEEAHEQIGDRDMSLLDTELEAYLAQESVEVKKD